MKELSVEEWEREKNKGRSKIGNNIIGSDGAISKKREESDGEN